MSISFLRETEHLFLEASNFDFQRPDASLLLLGFDVEARDEYVQRLNNLVVYDCLLASQLVDEKDRESVELRLDSIPGGVGYRYAFIPDRYLDGQTLKHAAQVVNLLLERLDRMRRGRMKDETIG